MPLDLSRRTTFDTVASLYNEVREPLPELVAEQIITLSGIPPAGRILEVGCGSGQATIPFARRGYRITCIELGQRLAALAAEKCRLYPNVEFQNCAFEDWPLQPRAFDLALSVEAFHWIRHEVGFSKAAATLKDGGAIAVAWHHSPGVGGALGEALAEVYRQKAPELDDPDRHLLPEQWNARIVGWIDECGCFQEVTVRHYPWSRTMSCERYIKWLNTNSDHRSLNEEQRAALLEAVAETISRFGGSIEKPYVTQVYVAQVKPDKEMKS